ncbi:hypothetical protein AAVH_10633 [Aphelenchoides avenae]|nr:hypothetical protein AAVH_10633 [Aphelenchus avenae]
MDARYRLPPIDDVSEPYDIVLYESYFAHMSFGPCTPSDDICRVDVNIDEQEDELKSFRDRTVKINEDEETQDLDEQEKNEVAYWSELETGEAGLRQNARRRFHKDIHYFWS